MAARLFCLFISMKNLWILVKFNIEWYILFVLLADWWLNLTPGEKSGKISSRRKYEMNSQMGSADIYHIYTVKCSARKSSLWSQLILPIWSLIVINPKILINCLSRRQTYRYKTGYDRHLTLLKIFLLRKNTNTKAGALITLNNVGLLFFVDTCYWSLVRKIHSVQCLSLKEKKSFRLSYCLIPFKIVSSNNHTWIWGSSHYVHIYSVIVNETSHPLNTFTHQYLTQIFYQSYEKVWQIMFKLLLRMFVFTQNQKCT